MDSENRVTTEQVMQQLTMALQESRGRTEQQLQELTRKLDQVARDLTTMEATLRKELQTQFVTRAEYEPRHAQLQSKAADFDRHIAEAEALSRQFILAQADIKQLRVDLNDLDGRFRGIGARALPWIAVAVSVLGAVANALQHIQFR